MSALVLCDARLVTMADAHGYDPINDAAVVLHDGVIGYAGPAAGVPATYADAPRQSLEGRLLTPGLIDCHTHLAYAGSRAREFEQRLRGVAYEEIARAGGGIASTVNATRAAAPDALLRASLRRLDQMIACGVTTVEIKSGYGLDLSTETAILACARALAQHRSVSIRTSFLGAHAIPSGQDADAYIDEVCIPALRHAHALGLVDAVDGYCEKIAFTPQQIERLFLAAKALGLPVKLHAEQLSHQGGAALAARFGALSADHLEYLDEAGVEAMARANVTAVLLPGAFYAMRETKLPPIDSMRRAGLAIAIATDCNPGTSPMTSLPLAMNMAAIAFRLTPEECLRGVTAHAARALGLHDRGQVKQGLRADLAIWDVEDPAELTYRIGDAPLFARYVAGAPC